MGYKDVQSAFGIELPEVAGITPMALRSVMNIVALATDDDTHQTFVSHSTIAARSGATKRTVGRALDVLVHLGILTKTEQYRANGARSVDMLTFDPLVVATTAPMVTVTTAPVVVESPAPVVTVTGGHSHHDVGPPTPSQGSPRHRDVGNEIIQKDHPVDHPLITVEAIVIDRFDEFWAAWPRKVGKPTAKRAWVKASKRADPFRIVEAALGYAANPHRPDAEFIPHPSTWLNRDGWDDELPGPRSNGRPTPTQRAASIAQAGQNLMDQRRGLAPVTTLNPKGISS